MDYFEIVNLDEVVGKPDKIFRDYSWIKRYDTSYSKFVKEFENYIS